jgi:hypothetical protein
VHGDRSHAASVASLIELPKMSFETFATFTEGSWVWHAGLRVPITMILHNIG